MRSNFKTQNKAKKTTFHSDVQNSASGGNAVLVDELRETMMPGLGMQTGR